MKWPVGWKKFIHIMTLTLKVMEGSCDPKMWTFRLCRFVVADRGSDVGMKYDRQGVPVLTQQHDLRSRSSQGHITINTYTRLTELDRGMLLGIQYVRKVNPTKYYIMVKGQGQRSRSWNTKNLPEGLWIVLALRGLYTKWIGSPNTIRWDGFGVVLNQYLFT